MKAQPQVSAVDVLVVRRKNLAPQHPDYNRWESMLLPGKWIATSKNFIDAALASGSHILWNPETRKRPVYQP